MATNNYLAYYGSYYGYPGTYCGTSYYNKTCCNPCKPQCVCKPKCNPCQYVCQPQCPQPCVVTCPQPCIPNPPPCPQPCPPCPTVAYVTNIPTATTVVSGGAAIPVGTVIAPGTTTVPAGTVTVINGFTGAATTNVGGITANNGFFTIPIAGRYVISANTCFAAVATVLATDVRELYIYRVDALSGVVTLLAVDSRTPIAGQPTCINLATVADLNVGDRVFVAARQINGGTGAAVDTTTTGRLAITRVC
ncbi:hypothetical protein QJ856_gp0242 [Tupanvirus deep ocean]|uniref:Uncharacterized protein n=2 Tax=Tupanvirus TaxID=2094720 RepID=A0AC62A9V0_9VIRU|nr:hypothetical protein QJ856_gp0242 [Tupanvirus deep ocean]QKU34489.1 hypothetical protein [Tupanvirus deep ocean]